MHPQPANVDPGLAELTQPGERGPAPAPTPQQLALASADTEHGGDLGGAPTLGSDVALRLDGPLPAHLGRYLVINKLGAGGMGVVLAAYDPELDRKVAIKLLRAGPSDDASARLLREAQALARLSPPHVVQIYDAGAHDRQIFIAMELVDGLDLRRWLAAGTRPWRTILRVFIEAGRGLAAAHAVGIIHRDFKPDIPPHPHQNAPQPADRLQSHEFGRSGGGGVFSSRAGFCRRRSRPGKTQAKSSGAIMGQEQAAARQRGTILGSQASFAQSDKPQPSNRRAAHAVATWQQPRRRGSLVDPTSSMRDAPARCWGRPRPPPRSPSASTHRSATTARSHGSPKMGAAVSGLSAASPSLARRRHRRPRSRGPSPTGVHRFSPAASLWPPAFSKAARPSARRLRTARREGAWPPRTSRGRGRRGTRTCRWRHRGSGWGWVTHRARRRTPYAREAGSAPTDRRRGRPR
ncbi:MAG: serine/threonine protein kinase [Nannocystis sp.]|nr:serine/threonine protein kinase [Nannocystis sp.]